MAIDFDHSHYTIEELFSFFDLNMDEKNVKKLSKVAKKLISNALEENNEELASFIDKTKPYPVESRAVAPLPFSRRSCTSSKRRLEALGTGI